jgi:hypothetical protein
MDIKYRNAYIDYDELAVVKKSKEEMRVEKIARRAESLQRHSKKGGWK